MARRLEPGDIIERRGSTNRVIMTYRVEEVPQRGKVLLRARTGAAVRVRWRYESQLPGPYSLRAEEDES